jgi:hypothetical protein
MVPTTAVSPTALYPSIQVFLEKQGLVKVLKAFNKSIKVRDATTANAGVG